jgi:DNA modification methylase
MNAPVAVVDLIDPYLLFLQQKAQIAPSAGYEVPLEEINPALKPFTRLIVQWAFRGGRRAIFASFGLHKTVTNLEFMRLAGKYRPGVHRLICLPLGVRHEFVLQALEYFTGDYAIKVKFVRTDAEITDLDTIYITNYESVREGKINPRGFTVTLDEADILRGIGGSKTFREFMRHFEYTDSLRAVFTATPDPNEFIELLSYAAFLGIMEVSEAKTRWFKRDSTQADHLTLHPHKEHEFYAWLSSWALFLDKPSTLGFSDDGYDLPPLKINWHEVESDHSTAGSERDGQGRLLADTAIGVQNAAREKRSSLSARMAKLMELRAEDPQAHRIIWHDLEAERVAIEKAVPGVVTIFGSQDLDEREQSIIDFSDGKIQELAGKPVMLGSGTNFQRHCSWAIFLGIGFKFADFWQSCHRLYRFLQAKPVRIDLIYSEAERGVRQELERKIEQHIQLTENMSRIIRQYGLASEALSHSLKRGIGIERREESGRGWNLVNNDSVLETASMEPDSVGLILTSIPFSTQYEYSASYNDLGHNEDNQAFWAQMDFLTPELYRVLQPGRVCAIHVKDRITPMGLTGIGFQTVQPFHAEAIAHYTKHGFGFIGMKTIVTDVVRENNQTYRLGWTEQCKDGTKMGFGMPEYLLLFRKPATDRTNGYADVPVVKAKKLWVGIDDIEFDPEFDGFTEPDGYWKNPNGYSRARWQLDAHGFTRSSGNRLLGPEDLVGLKHDQIYKLFRDFTRTELYDFEQHVRIAEGLERARMLPSTFMLLPPASWHPDVWADVARMRTLNGEQAAKGKEMHLCPLQFDIVDRLISQFATPDDLVFDPFAGLGTVPLRAVKLNRRGRGVELNGGYWADSLLHLRAAERAAATPSLFDLEEAA